MLLMLTLPLVGIWVKLLSTPYNFMFPAIIFFSTVGIFSINMNGVDLGLVAMFGLLVEQTGPENEQADEPP